MAIDMYEKYQFMGETVISDRHDPHPSLYRKIGKRILDLTISIALIPVVLPVIVVLGLISAMDGAMPFFGHRRVGKNGKEFRCWKIRTMVPDAERKLQAHLETSARARKEWEENFKLENDPRITRLGAFLRKTSLDELPQLWNVLTGQMSLVGPRPVTEDELVRYGRYTRYYTSVRPGITGPWQVGGRNATSYDRRVALDVEYVRSLSIGRDIALLGFTFGAVFKRTGL